MVSREAGGTRPSFLRDSVRWAGYCRWNHQRSSTSAGATLGGSKPPHAHVPGCVSNQPPSARRGLGHDDRKRLHGYHGAEKLTCRTKWAAGGLHTSQDQRHTRADSASVLRTVCPNRCANLISGVCDPRAAGARPPAVHGPQEHCDLGPTTFWTGAAATATHSRVPTGMLCVLPHSLRQAVAGISGSCLLRSCMR